MKVKSPNAYLTDKELIAKYKKLAHTADGRIRSIEAKIGQAKYKGIENYAYTAAKKMVSNIIGLSNGRPRFDRDISKLSRGQKEIMVGHVEQFLDYDTSTLSGYKAVWRTRTKTFNDNNVNEGLNVSVEEYRNLWESEKFKEMVDEYEYKDAFDSVMEGVNEGMTMQDAIDLAYKNKLREKYMADLKDIRNKLAQGKKVPIMDMTKITPDQITPDQIK